MNSLNAFLIGVEIKVRGLGANLTVGRLTVTTATETENSAIICALVKFTGGKSTRGAFMSDNAEAPQNNTVSLENNPRL